MRITSLRRSGAIAISALAVVSLAAACSSSKSAGSSTSTPAGSATAATGGDSSVVAAAKAALAPYLTTPSTISQTTPLPSPAPKGKSIIFLSQQNVPNVVSIGTGGIVAAKSIGWSASAITYDPASPASLQSAFSSALVKKPNFVVVTGSDPAIFGTSTLADYKAAGIPIIVTSEATTPAGLLGNPGGPLNFTKGAQALADWFIVDSGGKGSALLAHVPAFPILNVYNAAFTAEVKAKCPDCKVQTSDISVSQLGQGQTSSIVVAALRQSPSIKYVFFDDGSFASGITSALASAGLSNIKVGGANGNPDNYAAIKAGTQQAWIASSSYNTGWPVIDIALRSLEGAPIVNNDIQPFQIVTKDNLGSTSNWAYPTDTAAQYLKIWGVNS